MKNGNWHGNKFYFGLHFDLHANEKDSELGDELNTLEAMLKIAKPDFVQTDCKGHAGYLSWFSKLPESSIPPNLKHDCLKEWRKVTKKLGMPLHCHYSGIWDIAYSKKHPEFTQVDDAIDKNARQGQNSGAPEKEKMCVRSPYTEKLMIPQLKELMDNYKVDGFWIDGDLWACQPCYCEKCKNAFIKETGLEVPYKESDPNWPAWWQFSLKSFNEYVNRYCDAVHARNPKALVCSNWLHTFTNPGAPDSHVDWISGDNNQLWGLDNSRLQCRFISTRGKHWDLMIWNFSSRSWGQADAPWIPKPVQMVMQEAAIPISLGGAVQIYETSNLRSGRFIDWRMKRIAQIGKFIKKRQAISQNSESIPQLVVLHSEVQAYSTINKKNLMWAPELRSVEGAVFALLESGFSVDIMDEWALLQHLNKFPGVVLPECDKISDTMINALKEYVRQGGHLIASGAPFFDIFGTEFIGAEREELQSEWNTYYMPADDGMVPLVEKWTLLKPTSAKGFGQLGKTSLTDERLIPYPAATINKVGKGFFTYIPCHFFRTYKKNRHPMLAKFIGELLRKALGKLQISVKGPSFVDVVLRKKGKNTIIHLVNRCSGRPNQGDDGIIDEIPNVGPFEVKVITDSKPVSVKNAWEGGKISSLYKNGILKIKLSSIHIHEAIVIKYK